MNSVMIFSLLLIGKLKFSPNCKSPCISAGICVDDRLTNHLSLSCKGEGGGLVKLDGEIVISKVLLVGEGDGGLMEISVFSLSCVEML